MKHVNLKLIHEVNQLNALNEEDIASVVSPCGDRAAALKAYLSDKVGCKVNVKGKIAHIDGDDVSPSAFLSESVVRFLSGV